MEIELPSFFRSLLSLENLKLFRFYSTIANFMRWALPPPSSRSRIYPYFHKNLIIPQHSAQLMYFFALLENRYCEKDGNSQRKTFSLRYDVIRIISSAGTISRTTLLMQIGRNVQSRLLSSPTYPLDKSASTGSNHDLKTLPSV